MTRGSTTLEPSCAKIGGTTYIGRTIKKLDGLAPGTVVNVCGATAPPGWVATDVHVVYRSNDDRIAEVRVGVTGTPTVADYDADGRADAAVRTSDGRVVLIKSATGEREVRRSTRQEH